MERGKIVDHLFLHRAKTRVLGKLLFSLFDNTWEISESVSNIFMRWRSFLKDREWKVWQAGPSCLFWMVRKARSGITFRDEMLSTQN